MWNQYQNILSLLSKLKLAWYSDYENNLQTIGVAANEREHPHLNEDIVGFFQNDDGNNELNLTRTIF